MLLDIGCGSGLSGEVIESEGHFWCGVDISGHMLGKVSIISIYVINRKFIFLITII